VEDLAIIAPDFVTSGQFADMHRRSPDPIHRLLRAVLDQAIGEALCLKRSSGRRREPIHERSPAAIRFIVLRASRRRQNAIDWILDDAADGVFSFTNICNVLEIDAERLRARVRES
jgi:hypothetical protein